MTPDGQQYADRVPTIHTDGTLIFEKPQDDASEREVAPILEKLWNIKLHHFPRLFSIDWYASRDERLVGLVEIKTRNIPVGKYATVFLNYRKWHNLTVGSIGLGVPGLFVVRFTDALRWIAVSSVDASKCRIGGCKQIVKSQSDREIVIDVPVADMGEIKL